jgi:hypothetical protein
LQLPRWGYNRPVDASSTRRKPAISRFISVFRHGSNGCERRIDVSHIPLATLRMIFNNPSDESMVLSYDVEERHAKALQPYISEPLNLKQFDYFLEAEEVT